MFCWRRCRCRPNSAQPFAPLCTHHRRDTRQTPLSYSHLRTVSIPRTASPPAQPKQPLLPLLLLVTIDDDNDHDEFCSRQLNHRRPASAPAYPNSLLGSPVVATTLVRVFLYKRMEAKRKHTTVGGGKGTACSACEVPLRNMD